MDTTNLVNTLILYKGWIIFSLCLAIVTGIVAKFKNRFVFGWFVLGFIVPLIPLFFLLELETVTKTSENAKGG